MNRWRHTVWVGRGLVLALCIACGWADASQADDELTQEQLEFLASNGIQHDTPSLIAYLEDLQFGEDLEAEIDRLVGELGDDQWHVRESATQRLVVIGDRARASLTEALASDDPEVRFRAGHILQASEFNAGSSHRRAIALAILEVLKQRGDGQASDVLLTMVQAYRHDESVLGRASEALWASVDATHVPMLQQTVESGGIPERCAAIVALEVAASTASPEEVDAAVERIRPLLDNETPEVSLAAARALIDREPRAAVQALIRLTGAQNDEVAWQADALLVLKTGEAMALSTELSLGAAWEGWASTRLADADLDRELGADRLDLTAGRLWLEESFAGEQDSLDSGYGRFQYEADNGGTASVSGGVLRIDGSGPEGDQRLYITSQQMIDRDQWLDEIEVSVLIGGESGNNFGWHVGVSVGNVKVLFHPGQGRGYFRAETADTHDYIIQNADMTFSPATGVMHEMTVRVRRTESGADFSVTVSDGNGEASFVSEFSANNQQLAQFNRIGLERSGRTGADATFGEVSIRMMP